MNQDQILRKPNGLAWVLFADAESVQRAVEYYNSGQAFMYGTPFVISSVNVDVIADTDMEENALAKARFVFLIVSLTMKTFNYILTFFVHFCLWPGARYVTINDLSLLNTRKVKKLNTAIQNRHADERLLN